MLKNLLRWGTYSFLFIARGQGRRGKRVILLIVGLLSGSRVVGNRINSLERILRCVRISLVIKTVRRVSQ